MISIIGFILIGHRITAQLTSFFNDGHLCHCSCMHFFPMAFLITFKDEGTYPAHASKLNFDDKKLYFNMTQGNLDYVAFPFTPLKGNQMMLMTDTFYLSKLSSEISTFYRKTSTNHTKSKKS